MPDLALIVPWSIEGTGLARVPDVRVARTAGSVMASAQLASQSLCGWSLERQAFLLTVESPCVSDGRTGETD